MADVPSDRDIIGSVADRLPVGVWVARAPGGDFVYANGTFTEIMGMTGRGDVKRGEYAAPYGIHARDGLLYPEERMPFVRALEARETVVVDDIVIHRDDGKRVNIRARAKPIFDESGTITHVVIAFIDITREVRAEEARIESEARMRHAQRMESVGNLAAGIAHDFNNLLTAVKVLAGTLRTRETDDRSAHDLATIETICDSAAQLTRSLLTVAGHQRTHATPVWVDEVARDVATIAERTLDARIQVTADLDCPRAIVGDRAQVEQVVMNLVMNARDAMPDGGQLALRTRSEGDMVVLEVVDTGHGVPEELRDRIFEPYFSTRSRDGQRGAGLGLATVYGIVEAHRGTLDVRDNPAGGTIVRVAIPAAAPNVQRETAVVQETEAVTSVTSDAGLVMVVEDEPAIRRATSNALELLGYDVVCAEDGVQAVAIFEARHAELCGVVLDLAMPRLDGRRTYETMRAIDAEVPVLLTSGYAQEGEVQSVLDLGVKAFLPKPYDARTLAAALSRVVRGRREAVARP